MQSTCRFSTPAAPGGHLVIFRGLLDRGMENAEVLASVLTMNATYFQTPCDPFAARIRFHRLSIAAVIGDVSGVVPSARRRRKCWRRCAFAAKMRRKPTKPI
jgi:hypothetical protein